MSAPPIASAPPKTNNNPSVVNGNNKNSITVKSNIPSSVTSTVIKVANKAVNGNSNANDLARLLENPTVVKAAEELTKKLRTVGGRRTRKSNKH